MVNNTLRLSFYLCALLLISACQQSTKPTMGANNNIKATKSLPTKVPETSAKIDSDTSTDLTAMGVLDQPLVIKLDLTQADFNHHKDKFETQSADPYGSQVYQQLPFDMINTNQGNMIPHAMASFGQGEAAIGEPGLENPTQIPLLAMRRPSLPNEEDEYYYGFMQEELHDSDAKKPNASAEALLQQAKQFPTREHQHLLLQAAKLLLETNHDQQSASLLALIEPAWLSRMQRADYMMLQAILALKQSHSRHALFWLERLQLLQLIQTESQLHQLQSLLAEAYAANGQPMAAADAYITLSQQQNNIPITIINGQIWSQLKQIPELLLEERVEQSNDDLNNGWYELALLHLKYRDLKQQLQQLENWRQARPKHPANQSLPEELQSLAKLSQKRPRRIGLALPMQGRLGKLGQALHDGFMSAYYQAMENGESLPQIKIYDTSQSSNMNAIYNQALQDQVDLIIGPLDKQRVKQLAQEADIPIPTLAMNYIPNMPENQAKLLQFGLAVEDEGSQIANRAYRDDYRNALVILQDAPWAERTLAAFAQQWHQLGGKIVGQVRFTGDRDHSSQISQLLLIDQSKQRAKEMQLMLKEKINSIPRRRHDADFILLLALPKDARQIKPILAFHYAGDLPVYASHHIYEGTEQPQKNQDLNGIAFTDLPWVLQVSGQSRQLQTVWPERQKYTRLHALGFDSYRLHNRLHQLQAIKGSRLHGATGVLKVNEQQRIQAQLHWAKISNGKVQLVLDSQ